MDGSMDVIEAHRAVAILQDLEKKLGLLGKLPLSPFPSSSSLRSKDDELSKFVREEVHRHLSEHHRLQAQYCDLIHQWQIYHRPDDDQEEEDEENGKEEGPGKGKTHSALTANNTLHAEMAIVNEALVQNANQIMRLLKENPQVSGYALKVEREREELGHLIAHTMQELLAQQEQGNCENVADTNSTFPPTTLLATVEQTRRTQEQLGRLLRQEKTASGAVSKLEQDLQQANDAHQHHLSQQHAIIATLQKDRDALHYKNNVELNYLRREAQARANSEQRSHRQEEKDLERKHARLVAQQAVEKKLHEDLMIYLHREQEERRSQLKGWKEKASQDLGRLGMEHQEALAVHETILAKLETLRARREVEKVQEAQKKEAEILRREQEKAHRAARLKEQEAAKAKISKALSDYVSKKKTDKEKKKAAEAAGGKKKKKGAASPKGKAGGAGAKKKPASSPPKPAAAAAAATAKTTSPATKKKK